MTEQNYPINPPPKLVQQWVDEYIETKPHCTAPELVATRAAQWGADQELEACCEWIADWYGPGCNEVIGNLRTARRPKPPSLKEQAMQALCRFMASEGHEDCTEEDVADDFTTIRRALEQLPDPS